MDIVHSILENALYYCQFFAALIGGIYFFKLRKTYWGWFSIYLIFVFLMDSFWSSTSIDAIHKVRYFTFIGVPIEFIFFYWLYAMKSLKNKVFFILSVSIFLTQLIIVSFFKDVNETFSLNMSIGAIILMVLVVSEFIKQSKSDDILKMKENKMFYINLAMILFYICNYPYHVLGPELHKNHLDIWNVYRAYFLSSNCLMYLLFAASFIWGKTR
jgi:hypothetical protein